MSAAPELSIDERTLPTALLRLIVRAVGPVKALKLLRRRGGTCLKLIDGPLLHDILGPDDTHKLLAAFPQQYRIWLPKHDKITARLRDQVIRAEMGRKSVAEQALEHDLTDRQIKNIRHALPPEIEPSRQAELFGAPDHG